MNTNVRLFDANNKLVPNFDEEIEKILISIHGNDYYDTDEELVNTNIIPLINDEKKQEELDKTIELVDSMVSEDAKEIKIVENVNTKVGFKDFVPVLFFILVATVIVIAGYYFLNNIDLTGILNKLS